VEIIMRLIGLIIGRIIGLMYLSYVSVV